MERSADCVGVTVVFLLYVYCRLWGRNYQYMTTIYEIVRSLAVTACSPCWLEGCVPTMPDRWCTLHSGYVTPSLTSPMQSGGGGGHHQTTMPSMDVGGIYSRLRSAPRKLSCQVACTHPSLLLSMSSLLAVAKHGAPECWILQYHAIALHHPPTSSPASPYGSQHCQ